MKQLGSAADPLWYKDAIIYELHVKAFMDGNNDGIGDFQGLLSKLDYVQDLGVTCLWLLPFFPSPLRDDGYDISDYLSVHPNYGTMEDFREFLSQAHARGLQVMIELVINHTSDQHPWFQRARHAPKGSPERDFYVWSDTDQKYLDARIIFTDTEKSNWTWDPEAQQYYWHRFFSHQPDLNYDNPVVIEEVVKIMRYWLDMGVDGLRVDAIPYLVEREGTNCENLAETHAVMKRIRYEIDKEYAARTILAEANQWPDDVRIYYGNGDECHMAFHFPLMPRMYMALRQEDRLPITDIMAQTPDIPHNCQWGLFLRNHDELTLEMVSDDERDYMYLAYSADPRMRINIGIRRRLAPLVDNNRRRIELLNSLLFSFPGTPIVYYGDEIGMGDNIYLGDRNGVRTPMQWNGDRNAGFSRAVPAKLFSPIIMDPVWGYEGLNVEAQQSDPSSLLSWMRNMIALRKLFQVFGRGTLAFLNPTNRKILAYIREYQNEKVLCVANLSRFAQPVELDLAAYAGMVPVEMLGYVEFPKIRSTAYPLTVGPYGFLWLELQPSPEPVPASAEEGDPELEIGGPTDWMSVLEGNGRRELEESILRRYLARQRWFGAKSRAITSTRIEDWAVFNQGISALAWVEVQYAVGPCDAYLVTLGLLFGKAADGLREESPNSVLARLTSVESDGVLHEAIFNDSASEALLALITEGGQITSREGAIVGVPSSALAQLKGDSGERVAPRRGSAEQSNTSILFGDKLIMKLFRRQQSGPNPDTEIGRYITESTHFSHIAPFEGSIEYSRKGQEPSTLAMLQGLVSNEGDGWQWTLEELDRYYEASAAENFAQGAIPDGPTNLLQLSTAQETAFAREHVASYLDAAALLGRRTAEMHLALASPTHDPAFMPEPLNSMDIDLLREELIAHASSAFDALKENVARLPDGVLERAGLVLSRRTLVLDRFRQLSAPEIHALRTRIHGDYHLGQVLRSKGDFVILDFEGEPARSLAERRTKQSPLKDVAGMLRSFSYAAFSALMKYTSRRPEDFHRLEPWAHLWEQSVASAFLRAYREFARGVAVVPSEPRLFEQLLEAYVIDKAFYELVYELNNRPSWVLIPLTGILGLPI
ncbi:MAG TPA: maltose alpha-D-glucosyltransferase [Acidobacteriaceae bacterium]|nr:maltose alpha-D-glucosyltransferase [Acidobacteriaceae bacterium]